MITVGNISDMGLRGDRISVSEVDLESRGDEWVDKGEEYVG